MPQLSFMALVYYEVAAVENDHAHHPDVFRRSSRWVNVLIGGLFLVAAYFVLGEHWVHLAPYLPFLLLLSCPLMHMFMHHHHGRDGHQHHAQGPVDRGPAAETVHEEKRT